MTCVNLMTPVSQDNRKKLKNPVNCMILTSPQKIIRIFSITFYFSLLLSGQIKIADCMIVVHKSDRNCVKLQKKTAYYILECFAFRFAYNIRVFNTFCWNWFHLNHLPEKTLSFLILTRRGFGTEPQCLTEYTTT